MLNVLIPTDFSEISHNAIKYALAYFNDVAVNFYFLHVSDPTNSAIEEAQKGPSQIAGNETNGNAALLMRSQISSCKELTGNRSHKFYPVIDNLNLVEAIRKLVSEKEIDYIIMGTKGTIKINGDEIGSNTCDVITKVKCPILVVPENVVFTGIKNVAFLTDYNCIYRNKIISRLSETLDLQASPLRVLHIKAQNTELTAAQTDNKGFLHYFFKEKKHSFHVVDNKDLETGIPDFVTTWDIGLVSIVAKNLNLIQRLLLRPSIKAGLRIANVPFLVLHE